MLIIAAFLPAYRSPYLFLALSGFLLVIVTRFFAPRRTAGVALAVVHAVAGLVICFLPFWLVGTGQAPPGFGFVGLGGALIGLGGAELLVKNWLAGALAEKNRPKIRELGQMSGN